MKSIRCMLVLALLVVCLPVIKTQAQDQATITYWDWWVTQGPAVDQTIAAFEAAHPNIKVEKRTIGGGPYNETLNLAFEGDSAPDVFVIPGTPPFYTQVDSGWLKKLDEYPDFEEFKAQFPNPEIHFVEGVNVVDGHTYTVGRDVQLPWIQLYINLKLYRDAGLVNEDGSVKLPKTLNEVIENSRVIKEKTGKYGYAASGTQDWAFGWWIWMCARSSNIFSMGGFDGLDAATGEYVWSKSECPKQAIEGLLTLRDEDLILPDPALDDEAVRVKFAEGEFAHLVAGDWVIAGWKQTHPEFEDFTMVLMPTVGDEPTSTFYHSIGDTSDVFAVNAHTKHPEEAWELFKFFYTEEAGRIWSENGLGITIFTPGEVSEYATAPYWADRFAMMDDVVPGPQPGLRNPAVAQLQMTLMGPDISTILRGIYTGQIPEDQIDETLKDLDARLNDALDLAIEDAQDEGYEVSRDDFMFSDWNPLASYITQPE